MIWGIVALILLIIIIILTIWLLVRSGNNCPKKGELNDACSQNTDCNGGLVCSTGSGSAVTTAGTNGFTTLQPIGMTGMTGTTGRVCKVAFGGVCSTASECAVGQTCTNGICSISLGTAGRPCPCATGFTCINNVCRAVVGQPCTTGSECASGLCVNNVCVCDGMTGMTGMTGCYTSDYTDCYTDSRRHSRYSDSSRYSSRYTDSRSDSRRHSRYRNSSSVSKRHSRYSASSDSKRHSGGKHRKSSFSFSYSPSNSPRHSGSSDLYSCSDPDCSLTQYSLYSSHESPKHRSKKSLTSFDSYSEYSDYPNHSKHRSKKSLTSFEDTSCDYSSYSKHRDTSCDTSCNTTDERHHIKRGVYVTNQSNSDRTLFASVEHPIIDIAQQNGNNFYLLLNNGNIVSAVGNNTTNLTTNKKMFRMIRFGTDFVGIDHHGKLYSRNASVSTNTYWAWERLHNYPDAVFINSTNTYQNMEVLTCEGKALVYTYSSNWKNGDVTSKRRQKDSRYYGQDLNRYIDIDERDNFGKTNDGVKYRNIKAAGFYRNGEIVQVLCQDSFTHLRIINNNAYFLFEQYC